MKTTNNNVVEQFFIPIVKIKQSQEEELIPELMYVPIKDPKVPSNPLVAEWIAGVKKQDKARDRS